MGDEVPPRWWGEEGARPRPEPAGWWPEADTLHWVRRDDDGDDQPRRTAVRLSRPDPHALDRARPA